MPIGRLALWGATAAGLGLLGYTLVVGPPPLWVVPCALVAYFALSTAGVLVPRLEMYADVFWRGPKGTRGVALGSVINRQGVHVASIAQEGLLREKKKS